MVDGPLERGGDEGLDEDGGFLLGFEILQHHF